jgi:hypothetical protein
MTPFSPFLFLMSYVLRNHVHQHTLPSRNKSSPVSNILFEGFIEQKYSDNKVIKRVHVVTFYFSSFCSGDRTLLGSRSKI